MDRSHIFPREPECVDNGPVYITRLKVPGGWIITHMHLLHSVMTTIFYSDPLYIWKFEQVKPRNLHETITPVTEM